MIARQSIWSNKLSILKNRKKVKDILHYTLMSAHQTLITDGYILHTRVIGESDRILTILTPKGLLEVFARGVRKEKAKLRQTALPYRRVTLSIVRGRRDILKDIRVYRPLTTVWSTEKRYVPFVLLLKTVRDHVPPAELEESRIFDVIETATAQLEEGVEECSESVLLVGRVFLFNTLGYLQIGIPTPFKTLVDEVMLSKQKRKMLERQLADVYRHL